MEFVDRIPRRSECSKCGADAHVCKNCQHYDPKVYNECRETSAEVVREKDRSNYCDHFCASGAGPVADAKVDLFSAAEALFKKKS